MEIITADKRKLNIECEFFADETVPNSYVIENCVTKDILPKCPAYNECWKIYTRRREF